MRTARVFQSGNSPAVRLPIDFHIDASEVERAFEILTHFPEDFLSEEREDTFPQTRDF